MAYAEGTRVSDDKSRAEIEKMLMRAGASRFGVVTDWETRRATIGFVYKTVQISMNITLPSPDEKRFKLTPTGRWAKTPDAQRQGYEAEVRRRWRSLALALKAKLVAVEEGITTFEREFLPYMVTADGSTIADKLAPLIEYAMAGNMIPAGLALPAGQGE